jgi:phospholipid/cholesterol/gamma-HCH transport system substrate-binding protein
VTLSALASALDGRGARIGQTLSELDSYARALNQHTDALDHDISLTSSVSSQYADIAQPLANLLRHSTVTGHTLVARSADLDDLLDAADRVSTVGQPFIDSIQKPLTLTLKRLDPVTGLLAEYSPEYPCMLRALSHQALGNKSLGVKYPGAQAIMTLLPGQKGYKYPDDLPSFVNDRGPHCYSLPNDAPLPLPYRRYNDNSHANQGGGTTKVGMPPIEFFGEPTAPEGQQ